jgi:hypothetical protein
MILKKYNSLVLLGFILIFSPFAYGQKVSPVFAKVYVSLFPAGDFIAKLQGKGFAVLTNDTLSADNIQIDVSSFNSGISLRDSHAKNKYLKVKDYPHFKLIKANGSKGTGQATIEIMGKAAEVKGSYSISNQKFVVAKFKLKLSEFDIKNISFKGVGVEDDVVIEVTVPISAKPGK